MTAFASGKIPEPLRFGKILDVQQDSFSAMLRILPDCLRFCLLCLSSKKEIVQISALKILKFIFETQGCSLDYSLVFILKSILTTFPKAQNKNVEDCQI
jgi:hypothetical protein